MRLDAGAMPDTMILMRRLRIGLLLWSAASVLGMAAEPGAATGNWLPDRPLIAEIEAKIIMPDGAGPLSGYARYYTGVTEAGRAKVRGSFIAYGFVPRSTPPVTIVKELIPLIQDGGCAVVNLEFDVASKKMRLACNGQA